jgi:hypothetical protein
MKRRHLTVVLTLAIGIPQTFIAANQLSAEDNPQPAPATSQVFRASDWKGGSERTFEACKANSGEYTLWVYATATRCGVPREQSDRVVMFRQPLPGVSPIRAVSRLPGGQYAVWVYGAGEPGHPWVNLCGKTCVKGELPVTPGWVSLGWIEVRENYTLLLKSWQQPDGHQLYIQAVILAVTDSKPDWVP